MQVVESLTSLAVSAGNAAISHATMSSQIAKAGIGAFSHVTGSDGTSTIPPGTSATPPPPPPSTSPSGVSTLANPAALSDPGALLAQRVLDQVNAIKMLLTGGNGKPDWEKIRSKDDKSQSGANWVQASLNSQKNELDTSKPVSRQLATFIDKAIAIIKEVIKIAGSVAAATDDALDGQVGPTNELVARLQSLVINLLLQQPGSTSIGPATPPTPRAVAASGASQLAVQNSKMVVDQTRSQLEATRASFEKASDRLVSQQQEITKTIGDMTRLSLTNSSLQQMLPVLKKAVGAFTTLRAQFSQLVQFFNSVASLLNNVMGPSVERWIKTITSAEESRQRGEEERSVGGVTISAFTRDLIYRQMMTPLKVSMLATHISTVYVSVSSDYILPAQRKVGSLLQFVKSDSATDKAALIAQLEKSQKELSDTAQEASDQIGDKVSTDQKKFASSIDKRLHTIEASVQDTIPDATKPIPHYITAVTDAHVKDFDAVKAQEASTNPMFDADSAM